MGARKLKVVPTVAEDVDAAGDVASGGAGSVKGAAAGSRRGLLVALRDKIAVELDNGVPARELASLSIRLIQITEQIAEVDAESEGDDVSSAADTPDEKWDAR